MIDWPLTVRAANVLNMAGIRSVKDLKALGLDGLAELRNCGALTLAEIYCEAKNHEETLDPPQRSRAKGYLRLATRQGRYPLFVSPFRYFPARALIIALIRMGLLGQEHSLRQLAEEWAVCPERIRQLEQRGRRWLALARVEE